MNTMLTLSPRSNDKDDILSDSCRKLIKINKIKKATILSTYGNDGSSQLLTELTELNIEVTIENIPSLSVQELEHSDELRELAWNIANKMFTILNNEDNWHVFLGRGSRLHDHLLWLVATSSSSNIVHWDGSKLDSFNINSKFFESKAAPSILSNILELMGQSEFYDGPNSKWFNSNEISSANSNVLLAGVQAASKAGIDRGFLKIDRTVFPPLYALTKTGLPVALNYWKANSQVNPSASELKLLISFGRLLENKKPQNMLRYHNKIEPHDSTMFVLQRIDDDIGCSGTFSFSEALEMESLLPIHDIIQNCNELLKHKSGNEEFNLVEPLLVINPEFNDIFGINFYSKLFNNIRAFEIANDNHNWTFDITSCLSSISHLVSTFSMAAESKICYVVKSQAGRGASGNEVLDSPFTRSDHVLELPSSIAIKVLENLNDKLFNFILVLLHHEKKPPNDSFELEDIEAMLSAELNVQAFQFGLTKDDANQESEMMTDLYNHNFELDKHPTRSIKKLESNQLITRVNQVNPARYALTDLGEFVANWVANKMGLEW